MQSFVELFFHEVIDKSLALNGGEAFELFRDNFDFEVGLVALLRLHLLYCYVPRVLFALIIDLKMRWVELVLDLLRH